MWPALATVLLAGCAQAPRSSREPSTTHSAPHTNAASPPADTAAPLNTPRWLFQEKPSLRELTVVIKADPPAPLQAKYRQLAKRYRVLEPVFETAASESFGSGFVMVHGQPGSTEGRRAFVVTNRHVVGLASEVTVGFDGEQATLAAQVVFVDELYDLAVLALPADAAGKASGFAISERAARDQDAVVASGYPGLGGTPSYQVTRGYISNERFVLQDGELEQVYLQHTAPIDPGSSGGPLLADDGRVLGVNTLKIRGRENVGMAVPAKVVSQALEKVLAEPAQAPTASAACAELLADLGDSARLPRLERTLAVALVAEQGLPSLAELPHESPEWRARFLDDPTEVFLRAITLRLLKVAAGGSTAQCSPLDTPGADGAVSFRAQLGRGAQELSFIREQGRWKLARASLMPAKGRSMLDGLQPRTGAPKKWRPSLK